MDSLTHLLNRLGFTGGEVKQYFWKDLSPPKPTPGYIADNTLLSKWT